MTDLAVIDLDSERAVRREARGLSGEAATFTVRLDGEAFDVPSELPVECLSPLRTVDLDLSPVFAPGVDPEQFLRDMLVARPQIVQQAFDAARDCLARLFCSHVEPAPSADPAVIGCDTDSVDPATGKPLASSHDPACQWARFVGKRPSPQDLIALGRGLLRAYGVPLGGLTGSPTSAGDGGPTSSATSNASTDSTPAASTPTPETPSS